MYVYVYFIFFLQCHGLGLGLGLGNVYATVNTMQSRKDLFSKKWVKLILTVYVSLWLLKYKVSL